MKIKINQKSLILILNKMSSFLRSNDLITVSARNTCLYLYGSSFSTNISSEIKLSTKTEEANLEIIEKSSVQVNFGAFIKAIRESGNELLDIGTSNAEDLRLVINSSEFEIDIFAKDVDYHPGFSKGEQVGKFELEYLGTLFKEVSYSISKFKSRPLFNHVHFQSNDSKLLIEATDSHCMARHSDVTIPQNKFDLLIPEVVSKNVNKYFGKQGKITIEIKDNFIYFKTKENAIKWELYNKDYPNTQRLIPDKEKMSIYELELKSFKNALSRMIKLSDGGAYNTLVKLEFDKNIVKLINAGMGFSLFNYHQEILLLNEVSEMSIGVNPKYILEAINHLPKGSKVVKLVIESNIHPFVVESELISDTVHLATPIRMN
ncbi:DNA polymerase III subunit beta [Lactococcus lactis]|uniref:DNA polymerase III subunit beta n=1 Tax=Lactococcus lactis TaxID=1358 RepID=UPI00288FF203|nr:DNA polymerase III subunit beta [Lactococcus lactis]MDT2903343.1 DNA polymerase III subunit beta [Lactococcus lactis]